MNKRYIFTMCVKVHNERDLLIAAVQNYVDENRGSSRVEEAALELLKPGGTIDVHACLIQLFDPGMPPDGCEIQYSETEEHDDLEE